MYINQILGDPNIMLTPVNTLMILLQQQIENVHKLSKL